MKNLFFLLSFFLFALTAAGQQLQWASKVLKVSSEYTEKTYSALQVLGKPDLFRIKLPPQLKPEAVILLRGKIRAAQSEVPLPAVLTIRPQTNGKSTVNTFYVDPYNGEFTVVIPVGKKYTLTVTCPEYQSKTKDLDFSNLNVYTEQTVNVDLLPAQ